MEGFDDQISSTTPSNDELLRGTEYGTGDTHKLFEEAASYLLDNKESVTSDPMDEDDIIDLAGGARAAIESHKAAMSRFEDAPKYTKYSDFPTSDPEPEADQDMGSFVDSTEKQTKPMGEIAETETPKTEPRNPTKESSSGTSSYESFFSSSAPSQPLMQSSAVKSEATYLDSEDNIKAKDTSSHSLFTSKMSWYETESLTSKADPDEDSFLLEIKNSASTKNPFQGFSPISHSGGGFSQYGEIGSDSRAVKMSESPTPDLVQYAHDDLQDDIPAKHTEETHFDLVHKGSDSVMDPSHPSVPLSASPKEPEDSPAQPSLPDILESSPLSSGKQDSDLSEGSSDSDHSPVQTIRRKTHHVPVTHSATNPFAFDADTKISALKDKTVETGAKGAEMAGHAILPGLDQTFGSFDLVKEVDRHESAPYMNLQTSVASKAAPEEYDSDSPNTDSLSPVLEAMAKNPASFQVEAERKTEESQVPPTKQAKEFFGGRMIVDEPEASEEEGFEQEVSSEEFEIIERPPKGSIDEFVEKLDHSKFAKAPDMGADEDDEDVLSTFSQGKAVADTGSESRKADSRESSYTLLSQPSSTASPEMFGAELGNPFAPARPIKEAAPSSQTPLALFAEEAPKKAAPSQEKGEKIEALPDVSTATGLPDLGVEAVVDLLYWRDVKKSGVVFGTSLFLLLSLTLCSIVSICSYATLALLSVTVTFRIYKGILQAVQKSEEGHPFKAVLDQDVALSQDLVHKYSDLVLGRINYALRELRRLFLVEDLVDSLKFAVLMWILTYVGALFNGLTLLILGLISAFSLPVFYEKYQTQIDHYCGLVNNQVKDIVVKIQDKVPGMKRKPE
ncbi:reticulon-4a isoform X1 [Anguilla anguilla]|uniref:reticulon-4a isoform X1 n=1 Tax=Anguilla anguilla TaxID=7936 RepID=UPI0015B06C7D|nr:reticulon-4a isoform X1 [Anguilla anguilla]